MHRHLYDLPDMVFIRNGLVLFIRYIPVKILPVCSISKEPFPACKQLFLRYFHTHMAVVIECQQYRHFVYFCHVGRFDQLDEFPANALIQFCFFRFQFIQVMQVNKILTERIHVRPLNCHLIDIRIHISKEFKPCRAVSKHISHPVKLFTYHILKPTVFLLHLLKKIDQTHIEINQAVIRIFFGFRLVCGSSRCKRLSGQIEPNTSRLLIIPDKIKYVQIPLSTIRPKAPPQLLKKHHGRFRRPQEHHHIK